MFRVPISFDCSKYKGPTLNLKDKSIGRFKGYNPVLRTLDLSLNPSLSFEGDYPRLKELYICESELKTFRAPLQNLRILDLRCNLLDEFQGVFPHLKELLLSYCYIRSFHGEYPNLVNLELRSNELKSFGGEFPKLRRLDLEDNHLEELYLDLPCLRTLIVDYNPLEVISITSSLDSLCINYTDVKFVDPHIDLGAVSSDADVEHRGHALGVLQLISLLPFPIVEEIEPHIEV
jgi:hypothetical protein